MEHYARYNPNKNSASRIDSIWMNRKWAEILSPKVTLNNNLSDHKLVYTTIMIGIENLKFHKFPKIFNSIINNNLWRNENISVNLENQNK